MSGLVMNPKCYKSINWGVE